MNKFSIIRELGSGANGTVYLVNVDGEKLVYKIEKLDVYDDKKPLTSEYLRQVNFDKVAQKHPDKLMVLKGHGIIKNCSYKHPWDITKIKNDDRRRRFVRKNKQTDCYYLLYSPYLDGTYMDIKDKILGNISNYKNFVKQMLNIILIMSKEGYYQNDFNFSNIMYKNKGKSFQWYLIDYGQIWHKTFPISQLDKDLRKRDGDTRNNDFMCFINLLSPSFGIAIQVDKKKLKKLIVNTEEYKNLFKKMKLSCTRGTINIFKFVYPEIWAKLVGYPDIVEKYNKNKHMLPFKTRYYMATHLHNKNVITNTLKMI